MITYKFDGTFEGLITSFYFAFKKKETPNFTSLDKMQIGFLDIVIDITTDIIIYNKMEEYLISKCTMMCFKTIYTAFLNEKITNYINFFRFIKLAFTYKEQVLDLRNISSVYEVVKAKLAVERETHKILGLMRFKKIDEHLLYARYSPTHNITSLLCLHFVNRLNSFNFVIYDDKRNLYALYDKKNIIITKSVNNKFINKNDIEDKYNTFFKIYYKHVAIKERQNLKLQINLMPKKYWHFISEVSTPNNSFIDI